VEKIFIFGSPVLFPKRLDGGSGASARGGKTAATELFFYSSFVFLAALGPPSPIRAQQNGPPTL